jgi:glycosyltransferase involved in cell wall biosynthesis
LAAPRGLKVVTLQPGSGYGDAGCEYLAGLDALGVPVTWTPVLWNGSRWFRDKYVRKDMRDEIEQQVMALRRRRIKYDAFLIDVPPPKVHRQCLKRERKAHMYALVAWELDRLPDDWVPVLNRYERVFVPCEFNRKAFVEGGITAQIDIVPHIARDVRPVYDGPPLGDITDDDFVFYTIGTWTTRKAMEETVRAFLDAFSGEEKVALVVKTDAIDQIEYHTMSNKQRKHAPSHIGTTAWTLARIMAQYSNPPKVHLIPRRLPPREIDYLHTRGDCFVSLTRSEGWGLGPFDAAIFGNPVIVTGWGGQLDYLGSDYPYLVDYQLEPTNMAPDDGWSWHSGTVKWACADEAHASQLMRGVFEDRASARAVAQGLQPVIKQRFAPEVVCRRLAELMGFQLEA